MRRSFLLFIPIFLVLIASCASTSWVSNPYSKYSRDKYLAAVGYGETADVADLNAKVELASLFGLNVSTVTARTVVETLSDYDENFLIASSSSSNVDNLYGVEIVQRTVGKDGRYVALAVMEKKPTLEYLQGNLGSEEAGVERLYEKVEAGLGTLSGLESASKLVEAVSNYNTHVAMINYLSKDDLGGLAGLDYLDERKALDKWQEARDSFAVGITVTGDDSGSVKATISKLLTSCGLRVADVNDACAALVVCNINMREVQGSGVATSFVFAEYDASISMTDVVSGKTILSYSLNGKEGHQNITSAQTRALKDLNEKISSSFGEEVKGKFAGL